MTLPDTRSDQPNPVPGWEPIVRAIGPKVREARQQLGLSLQQLAARGDVSAAAIHKVERGDMVPTITTLLKLAAALGRPIAHFVGDADQVAPVAVHIPAAQRPAPPPDWAPAAEGVVAAALARPGEELLLVLAGTLAVEVAGEQYQVQPGDTLHYPTDRPYSWHNAGSEPVRAVWWLLHG